MKKLWGFVLIAALTLSSIASPLTMTSVRAEETVDVVANITNENDVKEYADWETAIAEANEADCLQALADIPQEA